MTCILATVHDGKVYMAGESAVLCSTWDRVTLAGQKVRTFEPCLLGFAGSPLFAQALRYRFKGCADRSHHEALEDWLVRDVFPAWQSALEDAGFNWAEDEANSTFLIGGEGRIFQVDVGWRLSEYAAPVIGLGSASDYAVGAWAALEQEDDPAERLLKALTIAGRYSYACAPPYYVHSI